MSDVKHPAAGEIIGHLNGAPVLADGQGGVQKAPEHAKGTPAEELRAWQRHFTRATNYDVENPKYKTHMGRVFGGEVVKDVPHKTVRAVVAHRMLHALSPAELAVLRKQFDATPEGTACAEEVDHDDLFRFWVLKEIAEGKALEHIGEDEPATMVALGVHAHPDAMAKHKATALDLKAALS